MYGILSRRPNTWTLKHMSHDCACLKIALVLASHHKTFITSETSSRKTSEKNIRKSFASISIVDTSIRLFVSQKCCRGHRSGVICNIIVKLDKQESTTAVQENKCVGAQFSKFCFLKSHARQFYKANNDW